jgi:thiol:disulfide interchange protein
LLDKPPSVRDFPSGQQTARLLDNSFKMKTKTNLVRVLFCLFVATVVLPARSSAADAPKKARPNIYDESLDGSKQIADALAKAKKENKRVLLQFGANWCGWCHKLHGLFNTDKAISEKLKSDYVVVLVDVNKGHNQEVDAKYGKPTRFGLPVIVILDSDGKQLTIQDTAKLEEGDHHSPDKVLAFLKEWSPKK